MRLLTHFALRRHSVDIAVLWTRKKLTRPISITHGWSALHAMFGFLGGPCCAGVVSWIYWRDKEELARLRSLVSSKSSEDRTEQTEQNRTEQAEQDRTGQDRTGQADGDQVFSHPLFLLGRCRRQHSRRVTSIVVGL